MNFNPGGVPQPQSTASSFTFNAAKPASTFTFGGDVSKPGSIFGATSTTTTTSAPMLNFLSPQASSMFNKPAAQPASTFSFGAQGASPAPQAAKTTVGAWPTFGKPAFGAPTSTAAVPTFGATSAAPTFGAAVPTFGAASPPPAVPTFGAASPPAAVPTFGAASPPAAVPTFGAASPPAAAPTFGLASPPTAVPAFGAASAPSAVPAFGTAPASTAPSAVPAFNFGQTPAATFNFGQNQAARPTQPSTVAVSTPKPAVSFGAPTFQSPTTQAPAAFGFTGQPSAAPPVSFGANPATSLAFGKPIVPTSAPSTGFTLLPATTTAQSGFNFGQTANSSFSAPSVTTTTATPLITSTTAPVAVSKPPVPSFGNTTGTSLGFSFGATPAVASSTTTAAASGFQLPTAPQLASVAPSSDKPATTITLSSQPATSAPTSLPTSGFQLSLPAATSAPSIGTLPNTSGTGNALNQPVPATSMTFGQLEDAINKWSLELEEQEKVFINQATQVNAWDKLLIANGEKIVALNEALQCVRTEQQGLDHELDFILGQQRELEELLAPLEKELGNVVISDPEREHTYRLADSIDTQLKQMSEDLKEIIEHLNESNRVEDNNDPVVQIGRILNAHMSSMQWIDSSTAHISNKLEQLSTMLNTFKHQNQRSFQRTFW